MTEETVEVEVKIRRFNPKRDDKAVFQSYKVPLKFGMSILNVLEYIYENLDSSLAYYNCCCRRGFCKNCYVLADGKPVLACNEILKSGVTLEPLPRRELIKDLYVKG